MKRLLLLAIGLIATANVYAQEGKQREEKTVNIGDTEYVFRSPFKVKSKKQVSDRIVKGEMYQKHINEYYIGVGFMCPAGGEARQPIYYGNSFNLQIGYRYVYRPARWYGIGTFFQYSAYSYKLKTNGKDVFDLGVATTNGAHYYRTDNLGTGILNRFYLFPSKYYGADTQVYIELGAWGDFSYSKRVKIKDFTNGHKEKYKYRDGSKFNPFQAGVQAGIGYDHYYIYAKYRLTDSFNHKEIDVPEVERFSIGVQLVF